MEVKLFELRDRGTFIPVMATRLTFRSPEEKFLLRRAGYADLQIYPSVASSVTEPYVILSSLLDDGGPSHYDPFGWANPRTFGNAHRFIIANWFTLVSGQVIDVEFILHETEQPKISERLQDGEK